MRSKDVGIRMKVVPTAKSLGNTTLERVLGIMDGRGVKFLFVHKWNKEEKCWWLRLPYSEASQWLFTAKEFKPYKENENEV